VIIYYVLLICIRNSSHQGNQRKGVYGSLTLGGYDDKRFNASQQVSFSFESDIELILTVYIKSIELEWAGLAMREPTAFVQLLSPNMPISALIDSSRPFIYLPTKIVDTIVKDWGLQWLPMPTEGYYIVNDTQHDLLLHQKPLLRFRLGSGSNPITPSQDGSNETTVDITLPYEALWHVLDFPYARTPTRFIPIKATNNSQAYMLGRTFLQEAYLTVDYERSRFSVAPALFPDPDNTHFVTICPENDDSCFTPDVKLPVVKPGLPTLTVVGVTVGAGGLLVVLILSVLLFRRFKLRKRHKAQEAAMLAQKEKDLQSAFPLNTPSEKRFEAMELDSEAVHESGGMPAYPTQEMPTSDTTGRTEMPDESTLIPHGGVYKQEDGGVDGRPIIHVFYEMDASVTSTPNNTTTETSSGGDTQVATPDSIVSSLNPPSLASSKQMDDGYHGDISPIPQTPLEFYGGIASNVPAGKRDWTGRLPGMPRVVFTPATPKSPTPEEVERRRWLRGHSGRGK
jgi:hypothetical protein